MNTFDLDQFYLQKWHEERERVLAACRALGALEYLTGPEFPGNQRERLARLHELAAELRAGLDIPPKQAAPTGGEAA